ncbi:MAG: hypothetical protein LLF98_03565 [Clostridium sp.]|uniref:hypothetical protein n=1 Tax=Clostridium sp. TaxID=1506 RepID=UPI0025BF0881|nr:hypothetical protein [Clostridium sp.]MCE5220352.1 hypothetical protein [Clostridium sp.]
MTKKLILVSVLMLSITLVSCTTKPNNTTKLNDATNSNTTTVDQNKDSNSSSTTENNTSKEDAKVNKIKLSIYTIDENSLEPNESSSIEVNESLSLEDKLKELSKAVSEKKFNKLPIEVKSIDTVNGKKVVTINLTDSGTNKWVPKFQGSTGGAVTSNTLIENFLQSNNKSKGEWIDGVKFLYNNKTIEYDHVSDLSTIKYRN